MKKITFILVFLSAILSATAQQDSLLLEKIQAHNRRMDSIQKYMASYLLDNVRAVELIPGKSEKELSEILDEYENLWDFQLMMEMEHLRTDLGVDTVFKKDDNWRRIIRGVVMKKTPHENDTVKAGEQETKKQGVKTSFMSRFNIGWNNFSGNDTMMVYDYWRSRYFGFDFLFYLSLDKKDHVELFGGGGILWSYLSPADKNLYHTVENNRLLLKKFDYDLDKSKLRTFWIRIPAGVQFNFNESWVLGVEAYGKFYVSSKQRLRYTDGNKEVIIKEKDYFNQNRFTWGLGGYIGFDDVRLTFGMDFAPYFKDYDKPLISIGFSL